MKLKCTEESLFTPNRSLSTIEFDKIILIENRLGKLMNESDSEIDEIRIKYWPIIKKEIKYLYHIQRLGGGLEFMHLCYAKANFKQHCLIQLKNFILWALKLKNSLKILTIFVLSYTACESSKSNKLIVNDLHQVIKHDTIIIIKHDTIHISQKK
jgi:hypothetical protein